MRTRFAGAALLAFLIGAPAFAADEGGLDGLLRGMAEAPGVVAHYREEKQLRLLAAPLVSTGILHFVPPDRMVRRTEAPISASLIVDGERVVFVEGEGPAVDLTGDPSARQFVDDFVVLFSGDGERLRERYEVSFSEEGESWQLDLLPRASLQKRFVRKLELRGEGRALREMVLIETDGDRTTTSFVEVDTQHVHDAAELRALFGDAGSAQAP